METKIKKDLFKYLKKNGLSLDYLKTDENNEIFIEIDGVDDKGRSFYKEINLPKEFQNNTVRDMIAANEYDDGQGRRYDILDCER